MFHKPFAITGLALGLGGVAAVTVMFTQLLPVNTSTAGFFFLMVVLGVATISGFRISAFISVVAMLCYNFFFLPPVGRFVIADPENWVALFTFLLTALVATHLSDRAQKQATEAKRRQQETEQLYALSRSILLTEASRPVGTQTAQSIAQIFDLPAVMIVDGKTSLRFQGGLQDLQGVEARLQDVILQGAHQRDEALDLDIWPIALGGRPMGALAATNVRLSDGAVQSILNLVAIALERVRMEEAANRAEIARKSEEFKSTLLDAIAHEFKTPLTAIKAAVTGMRATNLPMRPDQLELTEIIEEEADHLTQLVTEAGKMAEIDAGKVKVERLAVQPFDLLKAARATFEGRGADRLRIEPYPDAAVLVDADLMTLAIRQILDNALKYSTPGTPVTCEVASEGERVLIRIADSGPGIPESDRERIFQKFYRDPSVRDRVPGSGLGLYIAREIARIHGGDLYVQPTDFGGAVFCFSLPVAAAAPIEAKT